MSTNTTIQHKRSSVSGNIPDSDQIDVGELAINFPDRILYTKTANGEVIPLIRETEDLPLEGGTVLSEPTNTHPAGPVEWKGSGGVLLTASYPMTISDDGYNFTDKIETTNNDTEIWTKWAGEPGSGVGIDGDHGTTITGTVTDDIGGSQSFELTIEKETSFVFHNFVDSDQTVGGVSESRVVTAYGVNSYVYPSGTTTGTSPEYAKNGGSWTAMPATNAGSATDYITEGDEFQLRHQDAATNNTASTYNFIMAGDSADWTTVTADVDPVILQPKIASPATDGELDISPDGPFVSSDFEMAEGTDTHTASSWKVISGGWVGQPSLATAVSSNNMWSVAWDGTQFCTVGDYGDCATSPDGVTWTNQPSLGLVSPFKPMVSSVAWDGTQFCAVGGDGICATSPDGVTWTNQPSLGEEVGLFRFMNTVIWSGSQFCAVGRDGKCAISPDGVTWTNQPSFTSAVGSSEMYSVVWSGTQFCAVGESGKCVTSPDGVTWTLQTNLASVVSNKTIYNIAWNGSQFCAVGRDGKCATSPDGVTWTLQTNLASVVSNKTIYNIAWDGTQFCAVGGDGICATSPDGVTWTNKPTLNSEVSGNHMRAIAWSGTQFCATGDKGSCATLLETEASLDSDTSALTSWEPTGLEGNTDYKIRVKHHTATLNSEWSEERSFRTGYPRGEKWTNQPSLKSVSSSAYMKSVAWSGTQFCAVGRDASRPVGRDAKCATSPDGVTWTLQPNFTSTVVSSTIMESIAWDGTQFCAVGDRGLCVTSPDGVTWTLQSGFSAVSGSGESVVWSGSQFCTVGKNGACATSPDGVTWTNQPSLEPAVGSSDMQSVAWTGSQFCAVGSSGKCATSPDGVTWTNQPGLASETGTSAMHSVTWDGSQFCAVGDTGKCATSPDGVTWTLQSSLASAVSNEGMPAIAWTGTQFCAVGFKGKCATSPDGVTWTNRPSLASAVGSSDMNAVVWDGNQFCVVGVEGACATSP